MRARMAEDAALFAAAGYTVESTRTVKMHPQGRLGDMRRAMDAAEAAAAARESGGGGGASDAAGEAMGTVHVPLPRCRRHKGSAPSGFQPTANSTGASHRSGARASAQKGAQGGEDPLRLNVVFHM